MRNATAEEVKTSNERLKAHEFVLVVENPHNKKSLQVTEKDGVEEPTVPKRMLVRNTQLEHDNVKIWE
mgnify:CR=1 FL=1